MPSWHFSTLAKCEARLAKPAISLRFWHRIHAMAQPVEFFNRLLAVLSFADYSHKGNANPKRNNQCQRPCSGVSFWATRWTRAENKQSGIGPGSDSIYFVDPERMRSMSFQVFPRRQLRETGLEPARLSTPDPKSGASANSATRAIASSSHG
jgi:hypothetical protein